jgi:hypothetical protein
VFQISQGYIDYKKSCSLEPHYLTTRASKQVIYNYTTTRVWKYGWLINKMSCQKIKELYCSCNFISNGTFKWCNVLYIQM